MSDYPELEYIEANPPGQVRRSIIWLHGLGADGNDFVPVMHELALPETLGVRFLFPHAPVMPVTVNGGYRMRAWYDIIHPDLTQAADRAGIVQSVAAIAALLEREIASGISPENILLAGFSQGGVIALQLALRAEFPVAGVIALSTYLPLQGELPERRFRLPLFWGHGNFDPLIPIGAAESGRAWLQERSYPLSWHVYPMEHAVCAQEISDIRTWIGDRFKD